MARSVKKESDASDSKC